MPSSLLTKSTIDQYPVIPLLNISLSEKWPSFNLSESTDKKSTLYSTVKLSSIYLLIK